MVLATKSQRGLHHSLRLPIPQNFQFVALCGQRWPLNEPTSRSGSARNGPKIVKLVPTKPVRRKEKLILASATVLGTTHQISLSPVPIYVLHVSAWSRRAHLAHALGAVCESFILKVDPRSKVH